MCEKLQSGQPLLRVQITQWDLPSGLLERHTSESWSKSRLDSLWKQQQQRQGSLEKAMMLAKEEGSGERGKTKYEMDRLP